MLKVPNDGELNLLDFLTANLFDGLELRLYQNNYTPTDSSQVSNFTECDFSGYVSQTITAWTAAQIIAGHASSDAAQLTFTRSGGPTSNNVYGYFVTDSAGTKIYWAERDPYAPTSMSVSGDLFRVIPNFTLVTEF